MASLIEKIDMPGFHLVQLKVEYRDFRVHIPTTNPVSTLTKKFVWEVEFHQPGPDARYTPGHFSVSSDSLPKLITRLATAIDKMARISSLEHMPDIVVPIDGASDYKGFQPKMAVRAENSVAWLDFYVRFPVPILPGDAKACLKTLQETPAHVEKLRQTLDLLL